MAIVGFFDSLTDLENLADDRFLAGIVEEIIKEGDILSMLPVTQLDSKSLIYNREVDLPSGHFVDIGEVIPTDATVDTTQISVALKRIVAQYDLDKFTRDTYRNPNNIEAIAISLTRKGLNHWTNDRLVYANNSSNSKEFNGLHALVAAAMQLNQGSGATGAPLSLTLLDQLIDLVLPKADYLFMNKNVRRRMSALARGGSTSFPVIWGTEQIGGNLAPVITAYRDVPVIVSDHIGMVETISGGDFSAKTGGATTSIFACRLGSVEEGGLTLLAGNEMFQLDIFPSLEDKDASRYRLKWYVAVALGSTLSLGRIDGITDEPVVS